MKASRLLLAAAALAALLSACAGGGGGASLPTRSFPEVQIPAMLPQEEVGDFVLDHFWDAYLDTTGRWLCDSTHIAGVDQRVLATQLASFLSILENGDPGKAGKVMEGFFGKLERYQAADTASNAFCWLTESVDYYLYDPNSEIRSEELYLPFVSALAASPLTPESLRARYAHAAEVCGTNRIGSLPADFRFIDTGGRKRTLYGEKAPMTVLIFINPGCKACEASVEAFGSERIRELCAAGKVRVLGIYIDEDIDTWKAQAAHLPAHWLSGYDPDGVIRADNIYYVRAIPSVYLLDGEKRILMKDADPHAAAAYIENMDL